MSDSYSPGQNTGVGRQAFPSPGDLPNPGIEPKSPTLQADSLPTELSGSPRNNAIWSNTDGTRDYHTKQSQVRQRKTNITCVLNAQSSPTLCDPIDRSPWNSPGQNTGVGSISLLQGIFPTQGSNPSLPHYGQILYQLSF